MTKEELMSKKDYIQPSVIVEVFEAVDILTTSSEQPTSDPNEYAGELMD